MHDVKTVYPEKGGPLSHQYVSTLFRTATPALASGAVQAVLFNPFDRALYVRVHHQRAHFLDWRNFERPFQGFANAALYRTVCSASYIFWQDSCRFFIAEWLPQLSKERAPVGNAMFVGLVAGVANGVALNNLQAVKFRMWSQDGDASFFRTASGMWQVGGWRIFFAGMRITVMRDAVFGLVYELIRTSSSLLGLVAALDSHARSCKAQLLGRSEAHGGPVSSGVVEHRRVSASSDRSRCQFCLNMFAALVACAASSPLNYVRTVVYSNLGSRPIRPIGVTLADLAREVSHIFTHGNLNQLSAKRSEAQKAGRQYFFRPAWQHLNTRLNVGWGSLRVGLGMAVGQQIFALIKDAMDA